MKILNNNFFLDHFTQDVSLYLSKKIQQLFQLSLAPEELAQQFSSPPQKDWGHWALPCFFLSKTLHKHPNDLALQLAQVCAKNNDLVFEKTIVKGAYINFFFKASFLKNKLLIPLQTGQLFKVTKKTAQPWLIEYSQPNTHKELHIGHMRNICFGLALVTLLKKRGFSIISCTFPGDIGTHVAKCLWYLQYHNKESVPSKKRGQWLGLIYTKACQKFDEEQTAENKKRNQDQLSEILQQLQKKEGDFYILWQKTKLWSQDLMKEVYQWTGVEFDKWYWESEVDKPSVQWIKELYDKGKLELSQSAIGLNLEQPLGFCLLLKSDGNGLYATKDLYLAKKKFEEYKTIEKSIYIVDQRQERHFQQILNVLNRIGLKDIADKSEHLKYNFVELKSGVMSSRKGNTVPIMTVIKEMSSYIKTQYLQKYETEWTREKIDKTANIIAEGAIKYGMNEQDINKKIIFDMKEWLKLDGRSGPYIQYAYARSCALLKKFNTLDKKIDPNVNSMSTPEEWQLVIQLSWFSLTMEKGAQQMKTSTLCYYLFDLAKKFSQFYQNCPIGSLKNEDQKNLRLFLVQVVNHTLKEGLSYLSISAPEQM